MDKSVLLFDFLSATLDKPNVGLFVDGKIRDIERFSDLLNDSNKGNKLRTVINATHSGTIVNNRVYPGVRMKAGTETWTTPYPKPVTNSHPAPLGRMIGKEPDILGRVDSAAFHQLVSDEDLETDWKTPGARDQGSGFIRLATTISNRDAIQAISDKRMLTVSSGQRASAMNCSVCNHDWIAKGPCDHTPGKTYEVEVEDMIDGKKEKVTRRVRMFHITGDLDYDHIAMVMTPAQPYARIIESVLGDSLGDGFDVKIPFQDYYDDQPDRCSIVSMVLTDGDGGNPIVLSDSAEALAALTGRTVVSSKTAISVPGDGQYRAVAGQPPNSKTQTTDDPMPDPKKTFTDMELAERVILASILIDAKIDMDWDAIDETRDELLAKANELEADNYELTEDQMALLFDGKVPEEVAQDKVLTTKARKSLAGTTFCGPDRSFPVPDCAHAANAKSRLPQSKLSSDQKSRVLACVNRKANAMKCFPNKRKGDMDIDPSVKVQPGDHLQGFPSTAPAGGDQLTPSKPIALDTLSQEDLLTKAKSLHDAVKHKAKENAQFLEENVLLGEELRSLMAQQILDFRFELGRANIPDMSSDEEVEKYLDELASTRSLDYLRDALDELRTEAAKQSSTAIVADPTLSDTSKDKPKERKDGKGDEDSKSPKSPKSNLLSKMTGD